MSERYRAKDTNQENVLKNISVEGRHSHTDTQVLRRNQDSLMENITAFRGAIERIEELEALVDELRKEIARK